MVAWLFRHPSRPKQINAPDQAAGTQCHTVNNHSVQNKEPDLLARWNGYLVIITAGCYVVAISCKVNGKDLFDMTFKDMDTTTSTAVPNAACMTHPLHMDPRVKDNGNKRCPLVIDPAQHGVLMVLLGRVCRPRTMHKAHETPKTVVLYSICQRHRTPCLDSDYMTPFAPRAALSAISCSYMCLTYGIQPN